MGNVKMRVWDVKHGNAIYVRTPNDKNIVIDLGRGDYSEKSEDRSPLETLYDHYQVRNIDYLIITHPHRDHIDDILNLNKFHVDVFQRPYNLDQTSIISASSQTDRPKFEKYFELDERHTVSITGTSKDPTRPENYGGLSMTFFQTPTLTSNLNNRSIITILEYESIKIVVPGDNEYSSIDLLMQRDDFKEAVKDCDILIAPHHGRQSAYHSDFVTLANPRLSIISDGSICDTSANPSYSSKSRGWAVFKNGVSTDRKLLTTNSDGEIYIDFGSNESGRYLSVEIK